MVIIGGKFHREKWGKKNKMITTPWSLAVVAPQAFSAQEEFSNLSLSAAAAAVGREAWS